MPTYGAQIDAQRIPIKGLVPESGTTFPSSPAEGQMFHRSDLKQGYQFLNSGWVRTDTGGSAAAAHIHAIANVTGLQAALDAKAATSHSHTTAQVTGLDAALAAKASTAYVDAAKAQSKFTLQATSPATPPTGEASLFYKTDGGLYSKNALGVERPLIAPDSAMHPNPDFELGATAPGNDWSTFWTQGAVWSSDTTTAIEGTRSAKLVSSSTGDTVRLGNGGTFTVSAGSTIRFSVWAKASVVGNLEFGFFTSTPTGNPDWFGGESQLQTASRTVGTSWVRYEASFTVPPGHTKARIYFSLDNNRTWWLDASGSIVTAQAPVIIDQPFVGAVQYKAQTLPAGSWYNIDFWSPNYTHSDIVLGGGPESRTTFTVKKAGLYDIRFTAMFRNEVSSAGVRASGIFVNAAQVSGYYAPPLAGQADYASSATEVLRRLAVNDYINFRVLQNTAGNINVHSAPFTQCSIRWVSA